MKNGVFLLYFKLFLLTKPICLWRKREKTREKQRKQEFEKYILKILKKVLTNNKFCITITNVD